MVGNQTTFFYAKILLHHAVMDLDSHYQGRVKIYMHKSRGLLLEFEDKYYGFFPLDLIDVVEYNNLFKMLWKPRKMPREFTPISTSYRI